MSQDSNCAFVGSVSKKSDNIATWEYKLKVYASSIRGLYILQGHERCPTLPHLTPEPNFSLDPQAAKAFVEQHHKWKASHREELVAYSAALDRQKNWQQIDAQLLIAIINSLSDKQSEELLKVDRTSAAALKLIKSRYQPSPSGSKTKNETKDKTKDNAKGKGKGKAKEEAA